MHALNEGKWSSEMEESKIQQASEEGPYLHWFSWNNERTKEVVVVVVASPLERQTGTLFFPLISDLQFLVGSALSPLSPLHIPPLFYITTPRDPFISFLSVPIQSHYNCIIFHAHHINPIYSPLWTYRSSQVDVTPSISHPNCMKWMFRSKDFGLINYYITWLI